MKGRNGGRGDERIVIEDFHRRFRQMDKVHRQVLGFVAPPRNAETASERFLVVARTWFEEIQVTRRPVQR